MENEIKTNIKAEDKMSPAFKKFKNFLGFEDTSQIDNFINEEYRKVLGRKANQVFDRSPKDFLTLEAFKIYRHTSEDGVKLMALELVSNLIDE